MTKGAILCKPVEEINERENNKTCSTALSEAPEAKRCSPIFAEVSQEGNLKMSKRSELQKWQAEG